ncbi:FKBP-type peptidyl-prolyl cis-trans isomerase [Lysobacter sp. A3-1-A15]|uniref:FKBP-type peptidyl-prolyl cis-trans isomerase n=1 Tax=Novilysobacter viscosus TaxID=3098602 RepID=UPI002ED9A31A
MPRPLLQLAAAVSIAAALLACNDSGPAPGGRVPELTREDVRVGTGELARPGMEVTVHYTGWNYDQGAEDGRGTKFDSSLDRGQPLTFLLGAGRVIRGWDEGVAGMRVGGTRVLEIPPELGYGRAGAGGVIPPNGSLVFEVELLDVQPED